MLSMSMLAMLWCLGSGGSGGSVATSQAAHHLIIHPPGPAPPHLATTSQQQATADDLKAIRLKHQRRPDHCPLLSQSPMFRN